MYDTTPTISQQVTEELLPWYLTLSTQETIIICAAVGLVCGVINIFISAYNHRSGVLAFVTGFLLGPLGIITQMIMGESIEYRVKVEERTKQELRQAHNQKTPRETN